MSNVLVGTISLLALAAMLLLTVSRPAYGATITVDTDFFVSGCAAGSGADTINLPAGTYSLSLLGSSEDANADGDLDITDDLIINGSGPATTIIEGDDEGVIEIYSSAVEVSGLTVRAGTGPGIANFGTLDLNNVTVSQNFGGGLHNGFGHSMTVTDSSVAFNVQGSVQIGGGGGIYNAGTLTLNKSAVYGNQTTGIGADLGGGIYNESGIATINNSTVSSNLAGLGGGILNFSTLILNNSTVASNGAFSNIGGILDSGSSMAMKNTIVANNQPNDCSTSNLTFVSSGHNLDSDGTCLLTAAGDLSGVNPLLGILDDNGGPTGTHALLAGSPAIDAGSGDCPPPATDQRGVARPQGTACDIGAYEAEAQATPSPATTPASTPSPSAGPGTATATPQPTTPQPTEAPTQAPPVGGSVEIAVTSQTNSVLPSAAWALVALGVLLTLVALNYARRRDVTRP
jgi:hypothetical protein